jgi:hypothetical protein
VGDLRSPVGGSISLRHYRRESRQAATEAQTRMTAAAGFIRPDRGARQLCSHFARLGYILSFREDTCVTYGIRIRDDVRVHIAAATFSTMRKVTDSTPMSGSRRRSRRR